MDIDKDVLLELSNYLYERVLSFINNNFLKNFLGPQLFNGYVKLKSGILLSTFEDYSIFGDYAYFTPKGKNFLLTLNLVDGFYSGPDFQDKLPYPEDLNKMVANMVVVSNYGLERLSAELDSNIDHRLEIEPYYTIFIKEISSSWETPDFVYEDPLLVLEDEDEVINIYSVYEGGIGLKIKILLDIVDEKLYTI